MTRSTTACPPQAGQLTPPKNKSTKKKDVLPQPEPEQMDRFTQQTAEEQRLNLETEHLARLETQRSLSNQRVAAMWAELNTQLFALWNDVWAQRQKTHNEAFKAWLKLLSA